MHCIRPQWVKEKLRELKLKGVKVGKEKKFKGYPYLIQASILQIVENIGQIIGFDNIIIEPSLSKGDADIEFVDGETYHLQVKSPLFFKQKYWSAFTSSSRRFLDILSKGSRFAVGYVVEGRLILLEKKDVDKPGRRASLGILVFDTSLVPEPDIIRKIEGMIYESSEQLSKIHEKSHKIFVLDITHFPTKGSYDFYLLLRGIFQINPNIFKEIDGVCLFSCNLAQVSNYTMQATLIPVILNEGITSAVFRQPYQLYQGMMITLSTSMQFNKGWSKGWNNLLEINKEGFIGVDGIEYGPFWRYINELSLLNEIKAKYQLNRVFNFYRKEIL